MQLCARHAPSCIQIIDVVEPADQLAGGRESSDESQAQPPDPVVPAGLISFRKAFPRLYSRGTGWKRRKDNFQDGASAPLITNRIAS
jgi:hypothetical protein